MIRKNGYKYYLSGNVFNMSSAALARKRRANMPTTSTVPDSNQSGMSTTPTSQTRMNLTIPQVLSVFEKRIMEIEKRLVTQSTDEKVDNNKEISNDMRQVFDEYEERFEMLLTQINQMKEMLNVLQTYTMSVNKTLLERSGILNQEELNDLPSPSNIILPETRIDDNIDTILEESEETDSHDENKENNPDLG